MSLTVADWLGSAPRLPCLDLRSEARFAAGHLPGAANIPLAELTARISELPPRGSRLFLVGDEGGAGAALLAERAGWTLLFSDELPAAWPPEAVVMGPAIPLWRPNPWLVAHLHLLPPGGRCFDVGMGSGRNAVWLAQRGFRVTGEDILPSAVARAAALAERYGVALDARVGDVCRPGALAEGTFDVVLVVGFLERGLLPALAAALAPGGVLVYETFTREQALRVGKPSNPNRLFEPGELRAAFAELLEILAYREGWQAARRCVASLVARRP